MVICGQNFDFSVLNANDLDRFEDAQEKMQARNAAQTERFHRGGIRLGDHVRAQTRIAMDCIDTILGAGASARLGLDENDMAPVYDVLEELGNAFAAEKQRYTTRAAKPMNREQRRAQKKAQQRTQTAGHIVSQQPVSFPAQPPAARMVERVDKARHRDPVDAALRLADARVAMNALKDDPEAMKQLADYALSLAAGHHV